MMLGDLAYRIVLLLLLAAGLVGSARLRQRADRAGGRVPRSADTAGAAAGIRVAGLVYYGAVLLWLVHPPSLAFAGLPLSPWLRWSGAAVAGAGVALALWALSHLGRNVTPTAAARSDAELIVSGPYRWVRHPLYTSMGLTVPGFALLSANLLVLAGGLATLVVIGLRSRREEEELVERFGGAYVEYARRTGRFLPRMR